MTNKQIQKPIFIVGAGHSGTTFLGRIIEQHPDIVTWNETSRVWSWGNVYRKDDILTKEHITPRIKNYILNQYMIFANKTGNKRICDKTPKNCLRIPFVLEVFPDAKIIHLIRDGRAVMNSTKKSYARSFSPTEAKKKLKRVLEIPFWQWYVFFPSLPLIFKRLVGMRLNYWGAKPPEWSEWKETFSPTQLLAKQWSETVRAAIQEGRNVPSDNYLEIFYEDLVNFPVETMAKIASFIEVKNSEQIIDYCQVKANPSLNNKWKKTFSGEDLNDISEIIEPTLKSLGYE